MAIASKTALPAIALLGKLSRLSGILTADGNAGTLHAMVGEG